MMFLVECLKKGLIRKVDSVNYKACSSLLEFEIAINEDKFPCACWLTSEEFRQFEIEQYFCEQNRQ